MMQSIRKLETICIKIVMDLGIVMSKETTPTLLIKKMKEIETINGKYYSEDLNDYITSIQIRYDGEMLKFSFKKSADFHTVTFDNQKEISVNKELLYFVQLEEGATMRASVESVEDITSLTLRSEDSQWKWALSLEFRL